MSGKIEMPPGVLEAIRPLEVAGHRAYLVGGAVRDLLLGLPPKDLDVATDALPEEVMAIFPDHHPTGLRHGTVTVRVGQSVEVTTFRLEGEYSDHRRPDKVVFTTDLEADLARRDFTINAMALDQEGRLVDPWGGEQDLAAKLIRAVGDPRDRFTEDPLRMLRGVRLAAEKGFLIEANTALGMSGQAMSIEAVAAERIREEFSRLIVAPGARWGLESLLDLGMLETFLPELVRQVGFVQNRHHAYTVWEHTLRTFEEVEPDLVLRLAALFHDVAKPWTLSEDMGGRHFYGHDRQGEVMVRGILGRLRYPSATVGRVALLVRRHMAFFPHPGLKDKTLRKMIGAVGKENIGDLFALARADARAKGPGRDFTPEQGALVERVKDMLKKGQPTRLEELAVGGREILVVTGRPPGPWVGVVLGRLLELVLEDPGKNQKDLLLQEAARMAAEL